MQDITVRISEYCHPLLLWTLVDEAKRSFITRENWEEISAPSLTTFLVRAVLQLDLNSQLREWCERSTPKRKPDPVNSKYNLFRKPTPPGFRFFAFKSLKLTFSSISFLRKAAKCNDMLLVDFILDTEMAWYSSDHLAAIVKSGCYQGRNLQKYINSLKPHYSRDYLSNLQEQSMEQRFKSNKRIDSLFSSKIAVGRGISICKKTKIRINLIQECAILQSNLELLEQPTLYKYHINSRCLTREQMIFDIAHRKPKVLRHLKCTKEELDCIRWFPTNDDIESLSLVRYLREMNAVAAREFPCCYAALDLLEGKSTESYEQLLPSLFVYVHRRVGGASQGQINNIFRTLLNHWSSYRSDLIYYLYNLSNITSKKERTVVACKNDPDMLEWLTNQL